ncbi:MAG TPA: hypothetical protein VFQ54_07385 [Thermomicrobiales bacterium]|nr:hypothetical protein [Thermomicrobiales bacterium]
MTYKPGPSPDAIVASSKRHDRTPEDGLRRGTRRSWRHRVLAATMTVSLVGSAVAGTAGLAGAQDGTGAATPTPPEACAVSPATWSKAIADAPTATPAPSPTVAPTTAASPIIDGTPGASPAATPQASPVVPVVITPTTAPTGTPPPTAADLLQHDLTATSAAIVGCLSEGKAPTLVKLTGDDFRGQLIGSDQAIGADDFLSLADTLPVLPYHLLTVTDATVDEDSARSDNITATAVVTYTVGKQIRAGTWTFHWTKVDGKAAWVLESEAPRAPAAPDGAAKANVTIKDNKFQLATGSFPDADVSFTIKNEDAADHEFFVIQLGGSVKADSLLTNTGPGLPKGVTFIGQVTVLAGDSSQIVLTGLAPGTYTVVDLLPDDEGIPHLSDGMEATFTIK